MVRIFLHSPPTWLKKSVRVCRKESYCLLAPLGFTLFFFVLAELQLLAPIENLTIDKRFRMRAAHDPAASDQLVLVAIDEDSLKKAGAWPWPRTIHHDLLSLLQPAHPSVLTFDLAFIEPTATNPALDLSLGAGIDGLGAPVVTAAFSDNEAPQGTPPEPAVHLGLTQPIRHLEGDPINLKQNWAGHYPMDLLRSRSFFGYADSNPDGRDGIHRQLPLIVRIGNEYWPTLVTQTLLQYWKISPDQLTIKLSDAAEFHTAEGIKRVPINASAEVQVNYRNIKSYHSCGYIKLCQYLQRTYIKGLPWPAKLTSPENRLLVVGQYAAGLTDMSPSPLDNISPSVLVHLNVLNSILKNDYLTIVPNGPLFCAWLALGYLTLFGLRSSNATTAIWLPVTLVVAYIILAFVLFWIWSIELPIVWPSISFLLTHIGALILHWVEELHAKQEIKAVFASYISPTIMNNLLKDPESINLGGARKPVVDFHTLVIKRSPFLPN